MLAGAVVHDATGVGPVVTVPGQVIVVQSLARVGPLGTQLEAPIGPMLMTGQVVAVQEFAPLAGTGTQLAAGALVETSRQVVVV